MKSRPLGYLLAAVLGVIAGVLGVVAHGGPVPIPLLGIVLAGILVTSGAWLAVESWGRPGWFAYWVPEAIVTLWLLQPPPANDWVVVSRGVSTAWLVLGVLLPVIPFLLAGRRPRSGADAPAPRSEQANVNASNPNGSTK